MSFRVPLYSAQCRLFSSFSKQSAKMGSYHLISNVYQRKWKETCLKPMVRNMSFSNPSGTPGSGAGRGGGAGGSVRESGGSLGRYGAAQEEQFFFNQQREQLEKLKKKLKEEKGSELSQKKEK